MIKVFYYAGLVWVPVLFVLHFLSNMYRAMKHSWNNAKIQTKGDIESSKRYYRVIK